MRPSLMTLKAFVAVYEEHSFTAAAAREHATQPGISQHISQLEQMLGVQLFDRSKGRVDPTPAAHPFYAHCIAIMKLHSEAMTEAQRFRSDLQGEITVGISPVLMQSVIGMAIASFSELHPNVAIHVLEGFPDPLVAMTLADELDFSITTTGPCRAGIHAEPFIRLREVLVSPKQLGLEHLKPLSLGDAGPIRLLLPSSHYIRRHAIDAYCASTGADVHGIIEMDSVAGSLAVVAEGTWSTVLPSLSVVDEIENGVFTINPLTDPDIGSEFSLLAPSRRMPTPAAKKFSQVLHAACITADQAFGAESEDESVEPWQHIVPAQTQSARFLD